MSSNQEKAYQVVEMKDEVQFESPLKWAYGITDLEEQALLESSVRLFLSRETKKDIKDSLSATYPQVHYHQFDLGKEILVLDPQNQLSLVKLGGINVVQLRVPEDGSERRIEESTAQPRDQNIEHFRQMEDAQGLKGENNAQDQV